MLICLILYLKKIILSEIYIIYCFFLLNNLVLFQSFEKLNFEFTYVLNISFDCVYKTAVQLVIITSMSSDRMTAMLNTLSVFYLPSFSFIPRGA